MKNSNSSVYAFSLIIGDFIALLSAFVVAYILRVTYDPRPLINQISSSDYLKIWVLLTPIWLIIFALLGLYKKSLYEYRLRETVALMIGSLLGIMTAITYDFIAAPEIFPARLVPVYALILGFIFLLIERAILRYARTKLWRYGKGVNNLAVIGNSAKIFNLVKYINRPAKTGYKVVALCCKDYADNLRVKHFSDINELLEKLDALDVHTILFADANPDNQKVATALAAAQANHIAFKFVPAHEGILSNNIEVELFQGLPVVSVHQTALIGWGRIVKRLIDLAISGTAIIILLPVFIIIAVIIRFSDWGPAFFKQKRLSRFNTIIYIYKFRTHKLAYSGLSPEEAFAKMGQPELAVKYRKNGDHLKNDPRITKIGKFLRKYSLDELPQLINVFIGHISLVGPRALVPQELANYPFKNLILSVKSGVTGLAQISGRRDISFDERRALDLYYVQNWSLWMDAKIFYRTAIDVIRGRGAK